MEIVGPPAFEDLEHVAAGDFRDGAVAEAWKDVSFQARRPGVRVLRVAPAGSFLFEDPRGGLRERRDASRSALLGERITVGSREPAVGEGVGARLLQGHEREVA